MKVLQINTVINTGSTGRIVSALDSILKNQGHESFIAYGRKNIAYQGPGFRVGSRIDFYLHILKTRLFDRHGFASSWATNKLIDYIKAVNPDIIHLHNLHGYYLHVGILFNYLKAVPKAVVWTFHDCWPFTGHCSHYQRINCQKWQSMCNHCPLIRYYPKSVWLDNSTKNFSEKSRYFNDIERMVLVTPSIWMANQLGKSFLSRYPIKIINNGIDLEKFKPELGDEIRAKFKLTGSSLVLGVASKWGDHKGLSDFIKLRSLLSNEVDIVLVGLRSDVAKTLPPGILALPKTESIRELAEFYSIADVFLNPTYVDNFPTTNIEAIACGTPVITYNTGGSPEILSDNCGLVVPKGDLLALVDAIQEVFKRGKKSFFTECRSRALKYYNQDERFLDYVRLYESLI